jgi:cytochrome c biogenesis protein
MEDKGSITIRPRPGEELTLSFRQLYSTLLLATKDPGVPLVYLGCILMIAGLAVILFMSHQRIWIQISTGAEQGSLIQISGTSNKNKQAFAKRFQKLIDRLDQA